MFICSTQIFKEDFKILDIITSSSIIINGLKMDRKQVVLKGKHSDLSIFRIWLWVGVANSGESFKSSTQRSQTFIKRNDNYQIDKIKLREITQAYLKTYRMLITFLSDGSQPVYATETRMEENIDPEEEKKIKIPKKRPVEEQKQMPEGAKGPKFTKKQIDSETKKRNAAQFGALTDY